MMQYREEKERSKAYKHDYLDGLLQLIDQRQKDAEVIRDAYLRDIFAAPEKYRNDFKKMLGWPLVGHRDDIPPAVTMEKLSEEEGYTIFRMQITILEHLTMTGLFFRKNGTEKKPLVIVQHGGLGTPELISGLYGDTSNYNRMLERVIQYDVHAFAPQLLLWHEDYDVKFNRQEIDAKLKRVGSSITAIEVYGIMRSLDYFETLDDVSAFGMVGLSYGGFYTLFTAAADTRIKSAISCSFFNTRDQHPWSDWTWFGSAEKFDDAEIACLIYPRKLCIEIGTRDELFECSYGIKSYEKLKTICGHVGTDWLEFILFDGTHEFCHDDVPIERLVNDLL